MRVQKKFGEVLTKESALKRLQKEAEVKNEKKKIKSQHAKDRHLLHSFPKIFATYANKLILQFQKTTKAMMKLWTGFPVTFANVAFVVVALKTLDVKAVGVIVIDHIISSV